MIKLFERSCEDIVREPFNGSLKCMVLTGILIFLLGFLGFGLLKGLVMILGGQWSFSYLLALVLNVVSIVVYYCLIVLWAWAYRKAGIAYNRP